MSDRLDVGYKTKHVPHHTAGHMAVASPSLLLLAFQTGDQCFIPRSLLYINLTNQDRALSLNAAGGKDSIFCPNVHWPLPVASILCCMHKDDYFDMIPVDLILVVLLYMLLVYEVVRYIVDHRISKVTKKGREPHYR